MSNPYYTFTPAFVPGEKVRAGRVNNQFTLIEDAFDLLPASGTSLPLGTATLGVESGSGNAYVVAMPNTRLANAEGDEVVFKATHQNSGASTLQVDAIPAVGLKRYNGDALSSGDVLIGSYYVARYDATNGYFRIVSPALQTSVGTLTYATPTGQVKLAASAGSATTVIRSDADIALDQTISPTWSGTHTFSNPVLVPDGTTGAPGLAFSGDTNTGLRRSLADEFRLVSGGIDVAIARSTSFELALPLYAKDGLVGAPGLAFASDTNTGLYRIGADEVGIAAGGVLQFGVTATKSYFTTTATNSDFLYLNAGGQVSNSKTWVFRVGTGADFGIYTGTDAGVANGLGLGLTRSGLSASQLLVGPDGTVGTPGLAFNSDPDTGAYRVSTNIWEAVAGGSTSARFIAGALQIPDGTASIPGLGFTGDTDTGMYRISANRIGFATNGARTFFIDSTFVQTDVPFAIADGSVSVPGFLFGQDGDTGIYRTTANQIAIALGGVTAGEIAQGTFTATFANLSGTPTATATWQRFGRFIILTIPAVTANSSGTSQTITGIPSAIQPTTAQYRTVASPVFEVASSNSFQVLVQASGTLTALKNGNTSGFTNGVSGYWNNACTIVYQLI